MKLYAGCYTDDTPEGGILIFDFCPRTGDLYLLSQFGFAPNPSYLALRGKMLYAVSETAGGALTSFALEDGGAALRPVASVPSGGDDPCHILIWPDGRRLSVANYSSGSLAVFDVLEGGAAARRAAFRQHSGVGHDAQNRQAGPHVHSTGMDASGQLLAADLGLDRIFRYRLGSGGVLQSGASALIAPPGSGPRHFCFSRDGKTLYAVAEMGNQLLEYAYDPEGECALRNVRPLLDAGFAGENLAADIHLAPDGRFLYASNRGDDSIAAFRLGEDGRATFLERTSAHGRGPRNFCLSPDGRFALIANQYSGNIAVCVRDTESGHIGEMVCDVPAPRAVCLALEDGGR